MYPTIKYLTASQQIKTANYSATDFFSTVESGMSWFNACQPKINCLPIRKQAINFWNDNETEKNK